MQKLEYNLYISFPGFVQLAALAVLPKGEAG